MQHDSLDVARNENHSAPSVVTPQQATSRSVCMPQWCAHLIEAARSTSETSPEIPPVRVLVVMIP